MAATLEVGSDAGPLYFSASSIGRLLTCEQRYVLYAQQPSEERDQIARADYFELGSLIHTLKGDWWTGRDWRKTWVRQAGVAAGDPQGLGYSFDPAAGIVETEGWEAPAVFLKAKSIMEAWVRVNGDTPPWTLIAQEQTFDLPVPGVRNARIRGAMDGAVAVPVDENRMHDRIRILEEKTMGRWGREAQVPWDMQLGIYLWAARHLNPRVEGVVFEAISTYDYKPAKGKTVESRDKDRFKRIVMAESIEERRQTGTLLEIPLDWRMVDRTMEDVARAARRAQQLLKNPRLALRNVGAECGNCPFHNVCLTPWLSEGAT